MATKLNNLKMTSVDLVNQGANPDAHIRLFKRKEPPAIFGKIAAAFGAGQKAAKSGITKDHAATFSENMALERLRELSREMFDCCYAFSDSLCSIIHDDEMDGDSKRNMMFTSLDEFAEAIRTAVPKWAGGSVIGGEIIEKTAAATIAFDALWGEYHKAQDPATESDGADDNAGGADDSNPADDGGTNKTIQKEETEMQIDKSKMTPEDAATLAEFEKKYGGAVTPAAEPATPAATAPATEPTAKNAELHPEVKKALADFEEMRKAQTAEIEELKKSLEIERLTGIAKKYEAIGKKADELAAKLYDLKKAGGTVYDDYVALLDENLNTVEKSGLFKEYGKDTHGVSGGGAAIYTAAAEILKGAPGDDMTTPAALVKAFETNPELAAQYEAEYTKGGNA